MGEPVSKSLRFEPNGIYPTHQYALRQMGSEHRFLKSPNRAQTMPMVGYAMRMQYFYPPHYSPAIPHTLHIEKGQNGLSPNKYDNQAY